MFHKQPKFIVTWILHFPCSEIHRSFFEFLLRLLLSTLLFCAFDGACLDLCPFGQPSGLLWGWWFQHSNVFTASVDLTSCMTSNQSSLPSMTGKTFLGLAPPHQCLCQVVSSRAPQDPTRKRAPLLHFRQPNPNPTLFSASVLTWF